MPWRRRGVRPLAVAVPAAQAQDPDLPPWPPCGPVQNVINGNNNPNVLVGGAMNDQINAFEAKLVDAGVTIVKLFLHLSEGEQRERLLARLDGMEGWRWAWLSAGRTRDRARRRRRVRTRGWLRVDA